MKVKFRQTGPFGCGSFSLAHVFDDHRFLEELPQDHRESLPMLQRKLNKYHRGLFIDSLFITSSHFKSGECLKMSQKDLVLQKDKAALKGMAIPYLMGFSRYPGCVHQVAVIHDIDSGIFYLVDSCEEAVIDLKLVPLIYNYKLVAISVFVNAKNDMLAVPRGEFAHIFQ